MYYAHLLIQVARQCRDPRHRRALLSIGLRVLAHSDDDVSHIRAEVRKLNRSLAQRARARPTLRRLRHLLYGAQTPRTKRKGG